MNKKILSIFALIMAISILGVSCAKDNNTTNPTPTPTTPPISAEDAEKVVKAIAAVGSTGFNLSSAKVTASGTDYKTSVEIAGSANVKITDVISGINTGNMNTAVSGLLTVNADGITVATSNTDKTLTVTIPYTTTKENKDGKFIISFSFTGNYTFIYEDIALNAVQTALQGIGNSGSVTVTGTTAGSVDFATPATALVAAGTMAVDAKSSTTTALTGTEVESAVVEALKALSLTGVTADSGIDITTDKFVATENAGTVTLKLTPDYGYKFKTGGSDFTTPGAVDGTGVLTITITVNSKDSADSSKDWAAAA